MPSPNRRPRPTFGLTPRRPLSLDRLEDRSVPSATPATIVWNGQTRAVNPGHWIVAMENLAGDVSQQLSVGKLVLQMRGTGPDVVAERALGGRGSLLVTTGAGVSYADLRDSLAAVPGVRYVEPDFLVSLESTAPNDPLYPNLYGLDNAGQVGGTSDADIDAAEAWDVTTGSPSIVTGVIDSGVDYTHPDLAANMWRNPGEVPGDGIDNDGNGYKDDVYGYDFVNNDSDPMDDNGHGTHVSGTIGAVGNNGIGVAGINWQAKIMALKFLGANGSGPISAAVSALNYATTMRTTYGVNVRLTNNSWGGGAFSQAMSDAIAASGNAGMLFVAAAGNAATDIDPAPYYPASYNLPNVVTVASTDERDALSSFSNFGATTVEIAAPGSNILSTLPGNTYGTLSGTSMATPHVSGVAALAWSLNPAATYQTIRDAMYAGADRLPQLAGKVFTGGRLNALNTLNTLLGDVGDVLTGARTTGLNTRGDRFVMPATAVGNGTFAAKDVDLYRVDLQAGGALTAATAQPAGGAAMDTVLRLFDAAGVQVAANDNAAGLYSRLDFTAPAAGAYYVGVSGAGNVAYSPTVGGSGAAGSTGDYRLELTLDVGDTRAEATDAGLAVGGRFALADTTLGDGPAGAADLDLFRFIAPAGSTLSAVTRPTSGGVAMETALQLFDANGIQLVIRDAAASYSRLDYTFATSGTYYVGASGSNGTTGTYGLELTLAVDSPAEFELSRLLGGDGGKGFVVSGVEAYEELWGLTASGQPLGDVNGDGLNDLLLGAPGDINTTVGRAYLLFGRPGGFPAEVDLRTLDGTTGYVLNGMVQADRVGFAGGGAGDVNGDGVPDLVIGAIAASPDAGRLKAGQSFVVYGGAAHLAALDLADGTQDGRIALARLDSAHGFTLNGAAADDNAGRAVGVGDLNGDGFADLAVGAPLADPAGRTSAGQVYVVYGRASFPAVFELSSVNGSNGFAVAGLAASDLLGISVSGAGDVNGDGRADLVLGATGADPAGRSGAGQAYVVFGRNSFPAALDLATLNGTTGFTVNGATAGDSLGGNVRRAGDVNGDGLGDLVIGATGVDAGSLLSVGAAYVVFGKAGAAPAVLEVTSLNGSNGGAFVGAAAFDGAGSSVSWAGDFNGDGYDDLFIGASGGDPAGLSAAGQSYLVYGGPSFAASFPLGSLLAANGGDAANGFALNGFQVGAGASRLGGPGDLNGDGLPDLLVAGPYTDLFGATAAGQVYVVYGKPVTPAVRVTPPAGLTTTEAGGKASFSVRLSTRPTADVVIPVGSSDLTEGTVSVSSLTFTPANWSTPQTVTVTGVNDNYYDGSKGYRVVLGAAASGDPAYSGLNPADVALTNADDDLFTTTFTKTENVAVPDRGTVTSSLAVAATGKILDLDVRVNISHGWDEDLDVTLIAPDGTRVELFTDVGGSGVNFTNTVLDQEAATSITSGAAPFTGTYRPEGNLAVLYGKSVNGTWKLEVKDDERLITGTLVDWAITARYTTAASPGPGAVVTPTAGLVTTEAGGKASFSVRLDTAPTAPVTIPVSSSDLTEGTVSMSALTFTPADWNVPQTVTVTGVNDPTADGDVGYTVVLGAASSADPDFAGLDPADVAVTNTDNDVVTATFTKTANQSLAATVNSVLTVATAGTILDLDVKVNITHTNDADVDVYLIAPDGTRVELFTDVGGSGDNFTNTVLSDEATTAITSGSAPFTATYRPEGNLALFEGKGLAGNWTLEVSDDTAPRNGTLLNWSITVRYAIAGGASIGPGAPATPTELAGERVAPAPLPAGGPTGLAESAEGETGRGRPAAGRPTAPVAAAEEAAPAPRTSRLVSVGFPRSWVSGEREVFEAGEGRATRPQPAAVRADASPERLAAWPVIDLSVAYVDPLALRGRSWTPDDLVPLFVG